MMTRDEFSRAFIAKARSAIGVRWLHQGRNPAYGVDCAGLAVWAARECGLDVKDQLAYTKQPEAHILLGLLDQQCDRMPLSEMKPGDVLVLQYENNPQHLVILTDDAPLTICHAAMNQRRVCETLLAPDMQARVRYAFRFRGFE